MKKLDIHSSNGTGLMGYLKCDFQSLLFAFGDHGGGSADGKVRAEWTVDTPVGCYTVYDYKESTPVDEITEWHIGGHSEAVLAEVARQFIGEGEVTDRAGIVVAPATESVDVTISNRGI
jgi:hypothetical protein